jgi:hypothetical protein
VAEPSDFERHYQTLGLPDAPAPGASVAVFAWRFWQRALNLGK